MHSPQAVHFSSAYNLLVFLEVLISCMGINKSFGPAVSTFPGVFDAIASMMLSSVLSAFFRMLSSRAGDGTSDQIIKLSGITRSKALFRVMPFDFNMVYSAAASLPVLSPQVKNAVCVLTAVTLQISQEQRHSAGHPAKVGTTNPTCILCNIILTNRPGAPDRWKSAGRLHAAIFQLRCELPVAEK